MNIAWFKNPNHVVYTEVENFVGAYERVLGVSRLREQIEAFRAAPSPEGLHIKGKKRTTILLFIPDLVFEEKLDMGDTVWAYFGEHHECYCIYWPREETKAS